MRIGTQNAMFFRPNTLAVTLMLSIMVVPASARVGVQEAVTKWKPGQRMEVTLNSGERLIGKRGAIQLDGFVLEPDKPPQTSRELRFKEVKSVATKWTKGEKWCVALVVYGGLLVIGIILGN